jgi:hypothetical protein
MRRVVSVYPNNQDAIRKKQLKNRNPRLISTRIRIRISSFFQSIGRIFMKLKPMFRDIMMRKSG